MPFSDALRESVKDQCHFTCCWCRNNQFKVEVHHIIPQAEGGPDTEDNAAALCSNCHTLYGANAELRKEIRLRRNQWYFLCQQATKPHLGSEATLKSSDAKVGLSIVALDIIEASPGKNDQFPTLDVVLRNTGQVAVITEAIFHIRAVYESTCGWQPGAIKASWKYDVCLPILGAGSSVTVSLRQEVPSGGSDRFQFILGNDAPPTLSAFLFDVSLELVYDEDQKRLQSQPMLFIASPPIRIDGMNSGGDMWRAHVHNMKVVRLVDCFDGYVSGATQEWLREMKSWVSKFVAKFAVSDVKNRRFLAREVGKLGYEGREALTALREATNGGDEELREAARISIAAIESAERDPAPPKLDPDIHTRIRDWDKN